MLPVTSGLPSTWTWHWSPPAEGEVQKDSVVLMGLGRNHCCPAVEAIQGGHSGAHHSSTWGLLSGPWPWMWKEEEQPAGEVMYNDALVKIHSSPKPSSLKGSRSQLSGGNSTHSSSGRKQERRETEGGKSLQIGRFVTMRQNHSQVRT